MPPFLPKHSPLQLMDIIREVSGLAAPAAPNSCTQAAFNECRARAGHSDAPEARAIVKRLGVSWPTLLDIAHRSREDAMRRLRHAQADKGRKNLDLDRVTTALRQVALRIDRDGLSRTDYAEGRALILSESGRGRSRSSAERALPELGRLETVLRQEEMSWEQGLQAAGLTVPAVRPNSALTVLEAARLFADSVGKAPNSPWQLKIWAAEVGVAMQDRSTDERREAIQTLHAEREAAGLPPLEIAGSKEHLGGPGSVEIPPGMAKHGIWADRDEILDGLARGSLSWRRESSSLSAASNASRNDPASAFPPGALSIGTDA